MLGCLHVLRDSLHTTDRTLPSAVLARAVGYGAAIVRCFGTVILGLALLVAKKGQLIFLLEEFERAMHHAFQLSELAGHIRRVDGFTANVQHIGV